MSTNSKAVSLGKGAVNEHQNNDERSQHVTLYDPNGESIYDDKAIQVVEVPPSDRLNTIESQKTTVGNVATKINTPDETSEFYIYHKTEGTKLFVGNSSVNTTDGEELLAYERLHIKDANIDNENDFYGILSSGSVTVYCVGTINDE